jgi:hypothetical protein
MAAKPQVMISSTFFDLKQVRADLARFLSAEMGGTPLVSEWPSFPIDPDADTIENCRRRVEQHADILILVLGGRYGSVDSRSAKSVTNLEYLAARAKGIPIYAFVDRRVLTLLPVWRYNKSIDFSSAVDDTRIFSLIDEIRSVHKIWVNEFELAGEIVDALRAQFAYLLLQGAQLAQRARSEREYSILRMLRGTPLRIALEKPAGWEYLLFAELLMQGIQEQTSLNYQKRLSITHGAYEWIKLSDIAAWSGSRIAELNAIIKALTQLVQEELRRAVGPMGQPGDLELVVLTAQSVARVYQETLEWALRVRRVAGDAKVKSFAELMDRFADDIVAKIETLGPLYITNVNELRDAAERGEPPSERKITVEIGLPGGQEVLRLSERILKELAVKRP